MSSHRQLKLKGLPIQRGIILCPQPRKNALKGSADYSAPIQKACWLKTRTQHLLRNILRKRGNTAPTRMSIRHIEKQKYKTKTSQYIIVTNQINRYRTLVASKENEILKQTQNNKITIINFTHSSLLPVSLSNSRIKQSLVIGRVITELGVLTLTVRTTPDLSGNVLITPGWSNFCTLVGHFSKLFEFAGLSRLKIPIFVPKSGCSLKKKKKKVFTWNRSPKFPFWRKIIAFSKKKLRLLLIDKTCAKLLYGMRPASP